jgi:hypothetical protein
MGGDVTAPSTVIFRKELWQRRELTGQHRYRVGDQSTYPKHADHSADKDPIGDFFQSMHSAQASRAKRPVTNQTKNQEQQCLSDRETGCSDNEHSDRKRPRPHRSHI